MMVRITEQAQSLALTSAEGVCFHLLSTMLKAHLGRFCPVLGEPDSFMWISSFLSGGPVFKKPNVITLSNPAIISNKLASLIFIYPYFSMNFT